MRTIFGSHRVTDGVKRGRVFRFGAFELDAATGDLTKDGKARPRLRDQALAILILLLEKPQELVTREELKERVWAADTFVDFDHGLNSAINQLRNALGDSAMNPRFIQTLPRRGYRFIAPVQRLGEGRGPGVVAPEVGGVGDAAIEAASSSAFSILSDRGDLPVVGNRVVRVLFFLIQVMYLSFYVVALARLSFIGVILEPLGKRAEWVLVILIVTAALGIPVRLYLMTAAGFNYAGLSGKFLRLFPFVLVLDVIWALGPFLLVPWVGMGLALASCAVLLYVPFAQRSLLLMAKES
jgi:cholera toxin transcriptional activator